MINSSKLAVSSKKHYTISGKECTFPYMIDNQTTSADSYISIAGISPMWCKTNKANALNPLDEFDKNIVNEGETTLPCKINLFYHI